MQTRILSLARGARWPPSASPPRPAAAQHASRSAAPAGATASGMSQWGAYGFATQGWGYRRRSSATTTRTPRSATGQPRDGARAAADRAPRRASAAAASAAGRRLEPGARPTRVRRGRTAGTVDLISPDGAAAQARRRAAAGDRSRRRPVVLAAGAERRRQRRLPRRARVPPGGTLGVRRDQRAWRSRTTSAASSSRESPSGWPAEALKAQAVAARTYAVTTSKAGDGFDQYPDTRSQVYGGVRAETPTTDAAVRRDRGPGRHLRRRAGRHVLLLHLRRAHRGRREHARSAPSRSRG